ncbi:hypothetical protein QR685DRAFT_575253 [Neurospora intermedia]|uniref:Uncharacterized protein n=1 Tax=Neurospora intermedia TaxID=5142 RepID=A0ABR3D1R0_NEUIN
MYISTAVPAVRSSVRRGNETPIKRSADEIKSSFLPFLFLGSPVCSIPVLQVSPASLSTSFLLAWRRFVSSTVPRTLQGNFLPRPGDLPRHPSGAQKECHWLSLDWPLGHEKFATPNLHDSNSDNPNKAERPETRQGQEWTSVWNAKP